MPIEAELSRLNLTLPDAPKAVASYVPAKRVGSLLYVSGQLPMLNGAMLASGPVPSQVSVEAAQVAARQCVLNALAAAKAVLGDLSLITGVARVGGFVQCDNGFDGQPKVINGASDLLIELLGDAGRHTRAAVGTNALPLNAAVEVEFVFTL